MFFVFFSLPYFSSENWLKNEHRQPPHNVFFDEIFDCRSVPAMHFYVFFYPTRDKATVFFFPTETLVELLALARVGSGGFGHSWWKRGSVSSYDFLPSGQKWQGCAKSSKFVFSVTLLHTVQVSSHDQNEKRWSGQTDSTRREKIIQYLTTSSIGNTWKVFYSIDSLLYSTVPVHWFVVRITRYDILERIELSYTYEYCTCNFIWCKIYLFMRESSYRTYG